MSEGQQQGNMIDDSRNAFVIVLFFIKVWATSLEMFLHYGKGVRYPGLAGAAVLVWVPVWCMFWEYHHPGPMFEFLFLYIVMCVIHRIASLVRFASGKQQGHSYYSGTPLICLTNPTGSILTARRVVEPAMVAFLGCFIGPTYEPLGVYLLGGAVCLFLSNLTATAIGHTQVLDMQDAMVEQQWMAEQLRRRR